MANLVIGEGTFSFNRVVDILFSEDTSNIVSKNWKSLAQKLGLDLDRIEELDKQCLLEKKRTKDVVLHVLVDWKMGAGKEAKLAVLLSALQSLKWKNILEKIKDEFSGIPSQTGKSGNTGLQSSANKNFPLAWLDDAVYEAERKRQADAILNGWLLAIMKSASSPGIANKNEQTLIDECSVYIQKPTVLEQVFNDMFNLFKGERVKNKPDALQAILKIMKLYETNVVIQIAGTGCLIFVVNQSIKEGVFKSVINPITKTAIICAVANALNKHYVEDKMVKNACIAFEHFQNPVDIMPIYDDLMTILMVIFKEKKLEPSTELKCLQLLCPMVHGVNRDVKKSAGKVIPVILDILLTACEKVTVIDEECIQRVDTAWLIIVTLTDLQPENCRIFLDYRGLSLFAGCFTKFGGNGIDVLNMLIAIGNISEVPSLRGQLIREDMLIVLTALLAGEHNSIHISFATGCVLANILDGEESAWSPTNPTRLSVQKALLQNIMRWDINSTRNVQYRSLECLMKLLRVKHTKECQLWAAWELASLIKTNPDLYVPLIYKENGTPIINEVWNSVKRSKDPTKTKVKEYLEIIFDNLEPHDGPLRKSKGKGCFSN